MTVPPPVPPPAAPHPPVPRQSASRQSAPRQSASRRPGARALLLTAATLATIVLAPLAPLARAAAPPPALTSPYAAFMAGRYAAQTGDKAAAAHYFADALAADPGNAFLLGQSFVTALRADSPQTVSLAARLPDDPLAQMVLGNAAGETGRWDAAERHFAALPPTGLTGLIRPLLLAWAEAGAARFDAAIDGLQHAAPTSTFAPVYLVNAALIADMTGREAEAARLYEAVGRAFPVPNLRVAEALASFYARSGDPARGRAIIAALGRAHPDLELAVPALQRAMNRPIVATPREGLAEAYLTLAGTIGPKQSPLIREVMLDFALRLRPGFGAARMLEASIRAQAGEAEAAATALAAIPADSPLHDAALYERGQILVGLGRGKSLLPDLKALAKAHPASPDPLALAADIRRAEGDQPAAIRLYTEAIARAGQPLPGAAWSLYYGRAMAEDKAGRWPEAEADLRHALALSPGQPFVLNYLGYSYAVRGIHLAKAEAMLRQALAVDPNEAAIVDSLGYVLLREGKLAAAMREQIRAVSLAPADPEINAHLADIFAASGHRLAAEHQWERALSLNPDPAERAKIEARLKRVATPAATPAGS